MIGKIFLFGFTGSIGKKIVEELSEKLYLPEHIIKYADDCDYLYLWLDCDNEGENICFEVIDLFIPNIL